MASASNGWRRPAISTSVDTSSVEETHELGRRLGSALKAGHVVGLEGDLGTGKTELVRGIAEALEVTGSAHTPTFVLHHRYQRRPPTEHFALHRLAAMAGVDTG